MKKAILVVFATLLMGVSSLVEISPAHGSVVHAFMADLTWYHFEFNDPDCGKVVVDGWVNWVSNTQHDGYCVDVVSERCGSFTLTGRVAPDGMTDGRKQVTEASLQRYISRQIQMKS